MNKKLHIVSFDVPYPPNYGGVIDVFYKIETLSNLGVDIYLHTYEYGKGKQDKLKTFCKEIFYYPRKFKLKTLVSVFPFIILSRKSNVLIKNLEKINAPILFEGLHTTFPLIKRTFKDRKILIRTHNIEHRYYFGLAKSENILYKKVFYFVEALKLKYYQKILHNADNILSISPSEFNYFKKIFYSKVSYIPVFHPNNTVKKLSPKGSFALYHGDLSVADNIKAVYYLIDIFKDLNYRLVIAGNTNNKKLIESVNKFDNISITKLSDFSSLLNLMEKAHINILPTFQDTGIKLKLINSLFNGRFCLVNRKMITNTNLEDLCYVANNKKDFKGKILKLVGEKYTQDNYNERKEKLNIFNNESNAKIIINLL